MARSKVPTLKQLEKLALNKKYKVIATNAGHSFPMGTLATLVFKPAVVNAGALFTFTNDVGTRYNLYYDDFEWTVPSIETYEEELIQAKAEVVRLETILAISKELGVTEVDEDLIKVYGVLQTLKGDENTIEKAKAINAIIKGA